jgi:hypothetical protein
MKAAAMTGVPGETCKIICAVVADDGTDLNSLRGLREDHGIVQAFSQHCLGSSITADAVTRHGRLPEPDMVRLVEILVPESRADDVFDYVCVVAGIHEGGRGAVWQTRSAFCTPFALPEDVPDEVDAGAPNDQ